MFEPDELAGIVDCFGALTRDELVRACSEVAFRRGEEMDEDAVRAAIDDAIVDYALVVHDDRLVAGPTAFPTLPEGAADLPHILDAEERAVDRSAVAASAAEHLRADVDAAVEQRDVERARELLDLTYELESWGPVELGAERQRLDELLESAGGGE